MKNIGSRDRILRIAIAIGLAILAATGTIGGGLAIAAWVVAGVLLVTSLVGFCPAYRLLGLNTCGRT
tara:strand:+ start:22826 stop:23026 length:201 start_codon:yes stop_codon:yes gene_type:complete